METTKQMRKRVSEGRDPLTGEPFKTCAPHSVSARSGTTVCDGCGEPADLDDKGAWKHA